MESRKLIERPLSPSTRTKMCVMVVGCSYGDNGGGICKSKPLLLLLLILLILILLPPLLLSIGPYSLGQTWHSCGAKVHCRIYLHLFARCIYGIRKGGNGEVKCWVDGG
jgi:hypothetical protein